VQCIANLDCADLTRPECSAGHCTRCTSDAACSGRAGTPVCDLGEDLILSDKGGQNHGRGHGHDGACVSCIGDACAGD
jgi:hypothetical protein